MQHATNHQQGGVNTPPLDQRKHRKVEGQQHTYQTNRAVAVEANNPSVDHLVGTMNGNREHIQGNSIRYECFFL